MLRTLPQLWGDTESRVLPIGHMLPLANWLGLTGRTRKRFATRVACFLHAPIRESSLLRLSAPTSEVASDLAWSVVLALRQRRRYEHAPFPSLGARRKLFAWVSGRRLFTQIDCFVLIHSSIRVLQPAFKFLAMRVRLDLYRRIGVVGKQHDSQYRRGLVI